jgi:hypothetical protein
MKYIKHFESEKPFIKGDIVKFKDGWNEGRFTLNNEPFEITSVSIGPEHEGSKQYNRVSSLIRDYTRNWTLNKDLTHLTEKEKADLRIKLNILKFNI